MKTLSLKILRFIDEYLIDLNATQAAIRAGYSAKTAQEQGARLLSNVMVQAVLTERIQARQQRTEITQDRVLNELANIAFGNTRNVMTWGPRGVSLKDSKELSPEDAAIVAEASETTNAAGGSLKLKTHDKVKALHLVGLHLGMFVEKKEHSGPNGGPIPMTSVTPEQLAEAVLSVRAKF